MNEAQRSEYCREHGLYPEQLDVWKAAFEAQDTDSGPASKADLAQQRKKRGNPWIASYLAMTGMGWIASYLAMTGEWMDRFVPRDDGGVDGSLRTSR